jgi:trehalose 6-phosphate synthase
VTGGSGADGNDMVMVSNWLPARGDPPQWCHSAMGMTDPLQRVVAERGGAWVGGVAEPGRRVSLLDGVWLHPVAVTPQQVADHYHGHCLGTLAPLYLDAGQPVHFTQQFWRAYLDVNRRIADEAAQIAETSAAVWVHDYHLQLVPGYLRRQRPDLRIGFFLHTPFPPVERFARQPMRDEVLNGLLGADLIGFQQDHSARNFLRIATEIGGLHHDGNTVTVGDRQVAVRVLPASVDTPRIEALVATAEVWTGAETIRATVGDPARVLLSIGGPNPVDGVGRRLNAYAQLLADGRLDPTDTVLIHFADRAEEEDTALEHEHAVIDRLVAQINGGFARLGHPVVHYLRRAPTPLSLAAAYLAADVLLATPLQEGMTLAAKQYAAARTDDTGRIVLSEFSGAVADLPEADIVNPYDMAALKNTIAEATLAEQRPSKAMRAMRQRVREQDVWAWAEQFLTALNTVTRNQPDITPGTRR